MCLVPVMDIQPPIGVALTGGLLSAEGPLRRSVLARLREDANLSPIETRVDAVEGAVRLAGRESA